MVEHEGSANRIQENQANLKRTGRLPNVEYALSDLPPHIHFAGCLPRKPVPSDYHYPNWWPKIAGSASKKIVFVTQGTVACDWDDLLVPTLSGLKNRDDLLVVATLGLPSARLAYDINVPSNARVQDYLPYDAILQHADVFVTNGGYSSSKQISPSIPHFLFPICSPAPRMTFLFAVTHGVVNGVPQVLAGQVQDKREVNIREEWAGLGINLRMQRPTPVQILTAVDTVLTNPKYKERAIAVQKRNEQMDSMSVIEKQIVDFTEQL